MRTAHSLFRLASVLFALDQDTFRFLLVETRSTTALKAENISLRKQLALYREGNVKPRLASNATRLSLALFSRLFAWRDALVNVKPENSVEERRPMARMIPGRFQRMS
jgi:hypothetical protein